MAAGRNPFGAADASLKRLVVEKAGGAYSGERRLTPTGPLAPSPSYAIGSVEFSQRKGS
jgi:hypothetical protein